MTLGLVHLTVHHIGQRIGIYRKATAHRYILGRHGSRDTAPTAEGVTLLNGSSNSGYCTAVSMTLGLIHLTVHHIGQRVGIYRKATAHRYILSRHGCRESTPTAEGVTLLDGSSNSGYCTTVGYIFGMILYPVHHVYNTV